MADENVMTGASSSEWQAKQVYVLAVVCLLIGLAVGYLFRGSRSPALPANTMQTAAAGGAKAPGGMGMGGQQVSLDQMKHMADKQAEPLVAKLKDDPKNIELMNQIAKIYFSTHQFKEAADYFNRSLEVKPKDIPIRTLLASCLYYQNDIDGALKELEKAATDDPKDANALFNLGMIRWQGKKDKKGALEAWGQLLRTNPQLDAQKKEQVEKLMADVRQKNSTN